MRPEQIFPLFRPAVPGEKNQGKFRNLFNYCKKKWCPGLESNQRHCDFQSHALPTELPGHSREALGASVGGRRYRGLGTGCPADKRSCRWENFDLTGKEMKIRAEAALFAAPGANAASAQAGRERGNADPDKPWNQSAVIGLMRRRQRWRRACRRSRASRGCTGSSIAREAEFGRWRPPDSPDPSRGRSANGPASSRKGNAGPFHVRRPRRAASALPRSRPAARPESRNCP